MRLKFFFLIFLFLSLSLYTQDNEAMDLNTKEVKSKWSFNPFRLYDTDKYLYGWLDPYVYICL